jgi:hypothetical protein
MANEAKKKANLRRPASAERPVLYRGIKIAPICGARSPLAKAIRDGLQTLKGKRARGHSAQA